MSRNLQPGEPPAFTEEVAHALGWPRGWGESSTFRVTDNPDPNDAHAARWYLVMPGGSSVPFNHCAYHPMDEARVRWIAAACNAALEFAAQKLRDSTSCASKGLTP